MAAVLLPNSDRNMAGAKLRAGAVLKAVAHLGIERDITIKWANGTHRRGGYRFRDKQHVITLSTYYDAATLSNTLWHELTHAVQYERAFKAGKSYGQAWAEHRAGHAGADGTHGYRNRPIEVEAREWADHYDAQLKLAE